MDLDAVKGMIQEQTWKKTEYIRPHEYIVDKWNPILFTAVKALIITQGYWKYFFKSKYRYINIDGYKYWVIENILNREKLNEDIPKEKCL